MTTIPELLDRVERAFVGIAKPEAWADPNPDRSPSDEQYSRLTDPEKWTILGARVDAWTKALVELGAVEVERAAAVEWVSSPGPQLTRVDCVRPRVPDGLTLVIGRSRLGPVDDAGIVLAAGDPAVEFALLPDCGCDACDSGSQDALHVLDRYLLGIVAGTFRRVWSGERSITVVDGDGREASSGRVGFRRGEPESILADPRGWHELTGPSWLG